MRIATTRTCRHRPGGESEYGDPVVGPPPRPHRDPGPAVPQGNWLRSVRRASSATRMAADGRYPIRSLIIIALDVLVIWALAVHGKDFAADQ